ncbi:histidine phosphatase family protein [Sulfitobacter sp. SK012]|uniref:histidine phosphatase family protein n=1 Tax=Sulfitobacter sp. SK012 TaxID=1389005 RepID=UPI000E0A8DA6|nr:histidine phosphatase family protein [Sulfitobacter sp. SK012]AXI48041.1 histidine phosphatase family protein [Sulfitobacter sp. SK012]
MIRLALLRHGHTAWNREGRIQGRSDIALDAEAEVDLAALALPSPWDQAALWSSPLKRAARTAELVSGRKPQTSDALTEMNWGDWEGLHGTELRADPTSGFRDIEQWGWDYRPAGGESVSELRARLQGWVAGLQSDTVAVCHIGVMRVLLAQASGWNFDGPAPFAVKRGRLFVIEVTPESWTMWPDPVRLEKRP